jgi:hypothetical protein
MPQSLNYHSPAPRSKFTVASTVLFTIAFTGFALHVKFAPPAISIPPNYSWLNGWGRVVIWASFGASVFGVVCGVIAQRSDKRAEPWIWVNMGIGAVAILSAVS